MLETITNFYNHPIFIIVGGITLTLTFVGIVYKIICWFFSITPIVFRLGNSLAKRRVAIFANQANFDNLKLTLIKSNIFKPKRISHINNDIGMLNGETIFLVDWETFGHRIEEIFSARTNHQTPVIIVAKPRIIDDAIVADIANRENVVVVNFKGRLLNDILSSLITTSYE